MIFEEIKHATDSKDGVFKVVRGISEYRTRIYKAVSEDGISDPELPFVLAALKLVTEDIEAIINRHNPDEKAKMHNCCEAVCGLCCKYTTTMTTSRTVKAKEGN